MNRVDSPPPRPGCVVIAVGLALLANCLLATVGAIALADRAAAWIGGRATLCASIPVDGLLEDPE